MQGHRKIASAAVTFATGEVIGKDVLIWAWGLLDRSLDGLLGALPETVALEIIMLISLAAFYVTREEEVVRREPAVPREAAETSTGVVACRPLAVLAAVAMGLLLAACEWPKFVPKDVGIGHAAFGAPSAAPEPAEQDDQSLLDEIAHRIVAADDPQERALRVCLFSAVAAEAWVYRLLFHASDADEAMTAMGGLMRMQAATKRVQAEADSLWFETEMFYSVVTMVRALEGPVRSRALGLAGSVLTRDWRGLARRLRSGAGQGLLASAMLRDIRAGFERMARGDLSEAQAWAACEQRIAEKVEALSAALGIGSVGKPPELGAVRAVGPPEPG